MIVDTAAMEFSHHGDRDRGAAARDEPDQAAQCRATMYLLRDDKSLPLHPRHRGRPARAAARQSIAGRGTARAPISAPSASVWAVNRTMTALQRAFLLRTCTDSYYDNRSRPCLLHQIKRCAGPCTGEIAPQDYAALAGEARDFPRRALHGGEGAARRRTCRRRPKRSSFRARGALPRPASRRSPPSRVARTSTRGRFEEGGRRGHRRAGGGHLRRGVLLPQLAELGQPRLFPRRPTEACRSRRCSPPSSRCSYADKPPPRVVLLFGTDIEERAAGGAGADASRAGHNGGGAHAQSAASAAPSSRRPAQRQRRRWAGASPHGPPQAKLLDALAQAFGLDQTPTPPPPTPPHRPPPPPPPRRVELYDKKYSHIWARTRSARWWSPASRAS